MTIWFVALMLAGPADAVRAAETLAGEAVAEAATRPSEAIAKARRALAGTEEFEPTAFVATGRKGEVVEDEFLLARKAYRVHRARLYAALGECLARADQNLAASRYWRRSLDLDPDPARAESYARSLLVLQRNREALDVLLRGGRVSPEAWALAGRAADALGLPCLQCEIDRIRLAGLGVASLAEEAKLPVRFPPQTRLSTGSPFQIESRDLTLIYVAEPSCHTCSIDLETVSRLAPREVFLLPFVPADDLALRRIMRSYRYEWPLLLGPTVARGLGVPAPSLLVVGRGGWSAVLLRSPFQAPLPGVLEAFRKRDVAETVPRPAWNGRPPRSEKEAERPLLLPEGIAPGEDEPFPAAFVEAVAAFRANHMAQALKRFELLEQLGDGWLLPAEARLDRALCLSRLDRGEEARKLLLRIGDSRFQEAVDRALDQVHSPGSHRPPR